MKQNNQRTQPNKKPQTNQKSFILLKNPLRQVYLFTPRRCCNLCDFCFHSMVLQMGPILQSFSFTLRENPVGQDQSTIDSTPLNAVEGK